MSWCWTTSPPTSNLLPPYSPDFNPIELAFAKLKAFLRAARPRTFDQVCALMATALGLFMPDECTNYVAHCGYLVTTRKSKTLRDLDPGCPVVKVGDYSAIGTTDQNGQATIIVPPATSSPGTDNVVIGRTMTFDDTRTHHHRRRALLGE